MVIFIKHPLRKYLVINKDNSRLQFRVATLFADIINGKPHVIPAAISAIQGALSGARGGVDIPDADKQRIQGFVTAYQSRIEREQSTMANANAEDQGSITNIINNDNRGFGFKPKAGYNLTATISNTNGLINNNEADQMKRKLSRHSTQRGLRPMVCPMMRCLLSSKI